MEEQTKLMDLFVRSNQAFLSLICWGKRRFSSKRKGVLTLHYHTTRLYRGIQLQTTSFRLPNWNISQYFSVNTLPHYKAIQENTTTNYKLQTTKLKHKLILQCKHTTTLKFYNIQRLPWWSVTNLMRWHISIVKNALLLIMHLLIQSTLSKTSGDK